MSLSAKLAKEESLYENGLLNDLWLGISVSSSQYRDRWFAHPRNWLWDNFTGKWTDKISALTHYQTIQSTNTDQKVVSHAPMRRCAPVCWEHVPHPYFCISNSFANTRLLLDRACFILLLFCVLIQTGESDLWQAASGMCVSTYCCCGQVRPIQGHLCLANVLFMKCCCYIWNGCKTQ